MRYLLVLCFLLVGCGDETETCYERSASDSPAPVDVPASSYKPKDDDDHRGVWISVPCGEPEEEVEEEGEETVPSFRVSPTLNPSPAAEPTPEECEDDDSSSDDECEVDYEDD